MTFMHSLFNIHLDVLISNFILILILIAYKIQSFAIAFNLDLRYIIYKEIFRLKFKVITMELLPSWSDSMV